MAKTDIRVISNGVEGVYVPCEKFKKSVLSVSFFMPLDKITATGNSLLSGLLTRGTKEYDNYTKINARLNELYGASISSYTGSIGDMQQVVFKVSCINDKYCGEEVLSKAVALLTEMIFNPLMQDGLFLKKNFDSEKRLLIESIENDLNDKRKYALQKLSKVLYKDELCENSSKGDYEVAKTLSESDAVEAWKNLLNNAFVRIVLCSAEKNESIFDLFKSEFDKLNRSVVKENITKKHIRKENVKVVDEFMDVTQGKLCLGFSVDSDHSDKSHATLRVLTDIIGGGTYSNLFTNVREKQSLCYYCTARPNNLKGTIVVDSGILNENREDAQMSILKEIADVKYGGIDEERLNISKKSLCDSLVTSVEDSIFEIDTWYAVRLFAEDDSIEGYKKAIEAVSLQDVLSLAETIKLDSIYFLGKEEA